MIGTDEVDVYHRSFRSIVPSVPMRLPRVLTSWPAGKHQQVSRELSCTI